MLLVGSLSGIQDYLFDVAAHSGKQTRRLRARSFSLQLMTEIALLRLLKAAEWEMNAPNQLRLCAAGKIILQGASLSPSQQAQVREEGRALSQELHEYSGGKLRFALVCDDTQGSPKAQHDHAQRALQRAKLQPCLSHLAQANGDWNPDAFILPAISPPCTVCRTRPALHSKACSACHFDEKIGGDLPQAKWVTLSPHPTSDRSALLGYAIRLSAELPTRLPEGSVALQLDPHAKPPTPFAYPILSRKLGRHIPYRGGEALDFDEIAQLGQGAAYLGVLKMDADSLGKRIHALMNDAPDFQPLLKLSQDLETFFASELDAEMAKPRWSSLYTVFSGGDDLALVGPWNVVFDFAHHAQTLFRKRFPELTLSGGLAIVPAKTPILQAMEEAEHLLEKAKEAGRDRFATLGQVWEWKEHEEVALWAERITNWVLGKVAERGWLHTLLQIALTAPKEPLREAHLNYHIARNYPSSRDGDGERRQLREWANRVAKDLDGQRFLEARYLSATLRYALLATAEKGERR